MIKENELNVGDRVASTVAGFYLGIPATVLRRSQVQTGFSKRYDIELDTGKVLSMETNKLERLEGEAG